VNYIVETMLNHMDLFFINSNEFPARHEEGDSVAAYKSKLLICGTKRLKAYKEPVDMKIKAEPVW
jgi:hypothetical protein